MSIGSRCRLIALLLLCTAHGWSQIATDGTVGPRTSLTGPNFQIDAALGRQMGGNLFHSFTAFNVMQGESATFSGPTGVQNILARVTGAKPSTIDGTLASTIQGANLFLLNPAGIVFGPEAQLNISGSFTASTASSIRLGVDGRFDAADPAASVLTISPPSAFGFAQANPGSIRIDGSQLQVGSVSSPTGPQSVELSLVGGDIQMQNGASLRSSGEMTLVSVKSAAADVLLSPSLDEFSQGGDIDMSASTARASGSGKTHIRAGNLSLDNSEISRDNSRAQTGGGSAGSGRIDVGLKGVLKLQNAGRVTSLANSSDGGEVHVEADQIVMQEGPNQDGDNAISTDAFQGRAGDVSIRTGLLTIEGNGTVQTTSFLGDAGNINIQAQHVSVSGPAGGRTQGSAVGVKTQADGGKAGDITIQTDSLEMTASSLSSLSSLSASGGQSPGTQVPPPTTTPNGGNIAVGAHGSIRLGQGSSITTASDTGAAAGDITIQTDSLELNGGALSSLSSFSSSGGQSPPGTPNGGNITVAADDFIFLGQGSSITTSSGTAGAAGSIQLTAKSFIVANAANFGIAGGSPSANLSMNAPVVVINGSMLGAASAPPGGKISINACFLSLRNTVPSASAGFFPEDTCTPPIWPGNWPNGAPASWPESEPQDWPPSDLALYLPDIWDRPPLARDCGLKFDLNSFIVRGRGGVALDPAGWQPSVTLSPAPEN